MGGGGMVTIKEELRRLAGYDVVVVPAEYYENCPLYCTWGDVGDDGGGDLRPVHTVWVTRVEQSGHCFREES